MYTLIRFLLMRKDELAEQVADINNYEPVDMGGVTITKKWQRDVDRRLLDEMEVGIKILDAQAKKDIQKPQLQQTNVMRARSAEPLALADEIQKLIDKYEAEKKKAFENMQTMKDTEAYPWYEATWNNCLLFIHSLEDLKIKANANGA